MIRRRDKIAGAIGVFIVVAGAVGRWELRRWSRDKPPLPAKPAATGNGPSIIVADQVQRAIVAERVAQQKNHDAKLAEARVAEKKKRDAWLAVSTRKYPLPDGLPRDVRMWRTVMEPHSEKAHLMEVDSDAIGVPQGRSEWFYVGIASRVPFRDEKPSELAERCAAVLRERRPMNPGRNKSFPEFADPNSVRKFEGWCLTVRSVKPLADKDGWRAKVEVCPRRAGSGGMMRMETPHVEFYRYEGGELTLERDRIESYAWPIDE
jgi:hypothetical protein